MKTLKERWEELPENVREDAMKSVLDTMDVCPTLTIAERRGGGIVVMAEGRYRLELSKEEANKLYELLCEKKRTYP